MKFFLDDYTVLRDFAPLLLTNSTEVGWYSHVLPAMNVSAFWFFYSVEVQCICSKQCVLHPGGVLQQQYICRFRVYGWYMWSQFSLWSARRNLLSCVLAQWASTLWERWLVSWQKSNRSHAPVALGENLFLPSAGPSFYLCIVIPTACPSSGASPAEASAESCFCFSVFW